MLKSFVPCLLLAVSSAFAQNTATLVKKVPISQVWAGHPVGFAFKLHKDHLYIAYYDDQRRMTVATSPIGDIKWTYQILPSNVGWDSHNFITIAFDDDDNIHLAGNMHACPLIYFRTEKPLDITSFKQIPFMTGERERRCTYPHFMRGAANELIFHYRDGGSGNGDEIYNVYDCATKTWSRLMDKALTNGKLPEETMNAYFSGPVVGPDGYFHLAWVWRNTPSCDTNHDLSYMRSKDLKNWETVTGVPVELPVSLNTPGLIIDPTPRTKSGMINMGISVSFDQQKRVVVTYHKYDKDGYSQIYNARWEGDKWHIYQTSDWDWRWEFTGGGSVPCEVIASGLYVNHEGFLAQNFTNAKKGHGIWKLNPDTLKPEGTLQPAPKDKMPNGWHKLEGKFPGLNFKVAHLAQEKSDIHYFFTWETLGPNRDRPRPEPWPEPSTLNLWIVKGNL